jgi:hypothetical protein
MVSDNAAPVVFGRFSVDAGQARRGATLLANIGIPLVVSVWSTPQQLFRARRAPNSTA